MDSSCSIWSPLISKLILRGTFFLADLKITKLDFLTFRDNLLDVFQFIIKSFFYFMYAFVR